MPRQSASAAASAKATIQPPLGHESRAGLAAPVPVAAVCCLLLASCAGYAQIVNPADKQRAPAAADRPCGSRNGSCCPVRLATFTWLRLR